ncbi:MAG: hypothetical protein ACM3X9_01685 [Bacillota bacterium]
MKRWLVGFLIAVLLITCSFSAYAKHGKFYGGPGKPQYTPPPPKYNQLRNDARYIIHRTANVIFAAQRAAKRGRQYSGLREAIAHQQRAKQLYERRLYQEAIFHSLRARDIAIRVIERNRERPAREYYRDDMENRYYRSAPRDSDLDFRIDITKVGDDDAIVNLHFGLDVD